MKLQLEKKCCLLFSNVSETNSCLSLLNIYIYIRIFCLISVAIFSSSFYILKNSISKKFSWRQRDPSMNVAYTLKRLEPFIKIVWCSEVYGIPIFESFFFKPKEPQNFQGPKSHDSTFAFFEISLYF